MSETTRRRWVRRVAGWESSGLTCREYAARAGLKPATLAWWKWKLGRGSATEPAPLPFLELPAAVNRPACAPPGDERGLVLHVGEVRVEVPADFDGPTLARVLGVLGACQ